MGTLECNKRKLKRRIKKKAAISRHENFLPSRTKDTQKCLSHREARQVWNSPFNPRVNFPSPGSEIRQLKTDRSFLRPNAPVFKCFPIYHVALDCLLDDKGSLEPAAFFSAPLVLKNLPSPSPSALSLSLSFSGGSFYFAEPRACRRITFRCRVGFIARTPVLLTARYYRASLSPRFREPSRDETSKYIASFGETR